MQGSTPAPNQVDGSLHVYQQIVDSSPDAMAMVDTGYVYRIVNDTYERRLGVARPAILGRTVAEIMGQELFDTVVGPHLARCLAGETVTYAAWFSFPEVGCRYCDVKYFPYRDQHGAIAGAVAISSDVTARKLAEDALRVNLEKYRVLFELFPLGVTITDRDGKILECNREAERLLGVAVEEHVRRRIDSAEWQIIRPDGSPMPATEYASVRALRENRVVSHVEMGIVKGPGDITWISVSAAPIHVADYGLAIVYSDISKRMVSDSTLHAERASLARRVAERTAELSRINAELAQSVRARDGLLANLNHELQMPLHGMLGVAEFLLDEMRGSLASQDPKAARAIEASGQYLLDLADDLLDLPGLHGAGDTLSNLAEVDDVCGASVRAVRARAESKALRLSITQKPPRLTIRMEARALKRVLVDLLDRAVRLAPDGSEITLAVTVDPVHVLVHFAIRVIGHAIPGTDPAGFATPFFDLEGDAGLAQTQQLVVMQGGTLTLCDKDTPEQGHCIQLALPWYGMPEDAQVGAGTGEWEI